MKKKNAQRLLSGLWDKFHPNQKLEINLKYFDYENYTIVQMIPIFLNTILTLEGSEYRVKLSKINEDKI